MTSDPEFRRCPVSGRWVILAPERAARPIGLSHAKPAVRANAERAVCPFCPGMEHDTPPAVYTVGPGPDWRLRVVPNKFPAVRDGTGVHEVVIETHRHETDPLALTDDELAGVFVAYRERLRVLSATPGVEHVQVFKNVGAEAGASLAHLHSQVIATPMIPPDVWAETENAAQAYRQTGRNVFHDMLEQPSRLVAVADGFALACPFAPRFAYETWLLPTAPPERFEAVTDADCRAVAKLLRRFLTALDEVLGQPAYNWFLHTAPVRAGTPPHYQWHLEILPRTSRPAGFEWATGMFINAVPPERAAAALRERMPLASTTEASASEVSAPEISKTGR
jgi:UDPglucose--hexose-1-phosphate uridylyltransferase